jgi:hypothetical protein
MALILTCTNCRQPITGEQPDDEHGATQKPTV